MKFVSAVPLALSALFHWAEAAPSEHQRLSHTSLYGDGAPPYKDLKFSLRTRSGYCSQRQCPTLPKGFVFPPWTIHSLRALQANGATPEGCTNAQFKQSDVQTIRRKLENAWRSVTSDTNEILWEDEFNRYGACCLYAPYRINATIDYFQTALNLYRVHNVFPMLNESGITPSDTKMVALEDITKAIRGHLYPAEYFCEGQRNESDILQEIRLCFDARTTIRVACPAYNSTCKTATVWYLENSTNFLVPSSLVVVLSAVLATLLISEK